MGGAQIEQKDVGGGMKTKKDKRPPLDERAII